MSVADVSIIEIDEQDSNSETNIHTTAVNNIIEDTTQILEDFNSSPEVVITENTSPINESGVKEIKTETTHALVSEELISTNLSFSSYTYEVPISESTSTEIVTTGNQ